LCARLGRDKGTGWELGRDDAERVECGQLAAAIECHAWSESGSKLHALHTLRDIGRRQTCWQFANEFDC